MAAAARSAASGAAARSAGSAGAADSAVPDIGARPEDSGVPDGGMPRAESGAGHPPVRHPGSGGWVRWAATAGAAAEWVVLRSGRASGPRGVPAESGHSAAAADRPDRGGRRSAVSGAAASRWARHRWRPRAASRDRDSADAVHAPTARRARVAETARRRPDRARRGRRTRSPDLRSARRSGRPVNHPVGTVSRCAIFAHCAS